MTSSYRESMREYASRMFGISVDEVTDDQIREARQMYITVSFSARHGRQVFEDCFVVDMTEQDLDDLITRVSEAQND